MPFIVQCTRFLCLSTFCEVLTRGRHLMQTVLDLLLFLTLQFEHFITLPRLIQNIDPKLQMYR